MTYAEIIEQARELSARVAQILKESAETRKELADKAHERARIYLGNPKPGKDGQD